MKDKIPTKAKTANLKPIEILKERLKEIAYLGSAAAILNWDQEVHMPKKAVDSRAVSLSHLQSLIHSKFVSIDHDGVLSELQKSFLAKKLKDDEAAIVGETLRNYEREKKLPESFVREYSEVVSKSQHYWAQARTENNFALFLPWLTKIIELKRKEAKLVGFVDSPYDALIDTFEPGMTAHEASIILNDLKDFLVPFLQRIKESPAFKDKTLDQKQIQGKFPEAKQREFTKYLSEKMGFDFDAGSIEKSTHPFTTSFGPTDVRFTTRYNEKNIFESVGATIHEAGHALYEQGLLVEHFGTPLGEAISLGIHESQSRMWENIIGKSKQYWKYFYPRLQKEFPEPFAQIPLDKFYKIINRVKPSLIRIEADEVTYNLHIILRFEIEKEMIEGTIDLKDLPEIWDVKMQQYFGIDVPKDSVGVLQDVHWSCGLIGYFPTYSFGNLYSAQFFDTMKKQMPDIKQMIAAGNLLPIREWLRTHIHAHGKLYTAAALVQKVTGEPLSSRYFKEYLENKYKEIY